MRDIEEEKSDLLSTSEIQTRDFDIVVEQFEPAQHLSRTHINNFNPQLQAEAN